MRSRPDRCRIPSPSGSCGSAPQRFNTTILSGFAWIALVLAAAGILIGLGASAAITHVLQRVLFDAHASDPATFAGTAAVFLAVAVGASALPARRALRIDPVQALRSE